MSFSDVTKKTKQGLIVPSLTATKKSENTMEQFSAGGGGQGSIPSRGRRRSEYLTNKKRNRLRLHDRKSINKDDGWAEQGGYMNAKRQKLEKQFKSNIQREIFNCGQSTNIFQGISIYVDGYTRPSSDELKRLMQLHGGHYEMYLSKERVTHIIATNLPDSKIVSLRNYKVIHPDWILKSIESGQLLSCNQFQLFTAQSKLQKGILQFSTSVSRNQNTTTTTKINSAETDLFAVEKKSSFLRESTVSPIDRENETNPVDVFSESPQSCHSDDLFVSSFEESSQESKKSSQGQHGANVEHRSQERQNLPISQEDSSASDPGPEGYSKPIQEELPRTSVSGDDNGTVLSPAGIKPSSSGYGTDLKIPAYSRLIPEEFSRTLVSGDDKGTGLSPAGIKPSSSGYGTDLKMPAYSKLIPEEFLKTSVSGDDKGTGLSTNTIKPFSSGYGTDLKMPAYSKLIPEELCRTSVSKDNKGTSLSTNTIKPSSSGYGTGLKLPAYSKLIPEELLKTSVSGDNKGTVLSTNIIKPSSSGYGTDLKMPAYSKLIPEELCRTSVSKDNKGTGLSTAGIKPTSSGYGTDLQLPAYSKLIPEELCRTSVSKDNKGTGLSTAGIKPTSSGYGTDLQLPAYSKLIPEEFLKTSVSGDDKGISLSPAGIKPTSSDYGTDLKLPAHSFPDLLPDDTRPDTKKSGNQKTEIQVEKPIPKNSSNPDIVLESSSSEFTDKETVNSTSFTKITSAPPKKGPDSPKAKTARDPKYLGQFYDNSRLHHLSTWKVEWKNYVSAIKTKVGNHFPGRNKLKSSLPSSSSTPLASSRNPSPSRRTIMHIDMDCFFVSVAVRDRPELKGKAVGVTHSQKKGPIFNRPGVNQEYERRQWTERRQKRALKGKRSLISAPSVTESTFDDDDDDDLFEENGNKDSSASSNSCPRSQHRPEQKSGDIEMESHYSFSEIASCNYVAQKAGLKNGMFIGDALKLCPDLITLPYEFEKYQEVSKILYDTVTSYTHDIEAVSCDEMLVDCTSLLQETGISADHFASVLRQEIFTKTGCTASAGLGPNILLARLATHKAKPNGQFLVQNSEIADFIKDQSIRNIPGVGRSMMYKLDYLRVKTCGELQNVSLSKLQQEFGQKTGQSLYNFCRGKDDRPLVTDYNQKSVSAEMNYGIRFKNDNDMKEFLEGLSREVENRLKKANKRGKTITLKLMVRRPDAPLESAKYMGHGLCNNLCKSVTLGMATDNSSLISRKCMSIYKDLKLVASDLRGIGISVQRLEDSQNITLSNHFMGGPPKSGDILKFAKALHTEPPEGSQSPPILFTQEDPDIFILDNQDKEMDICPMKPIHVKRFGTVDFKEELSRQKLKRKERPPLPRLPSQGTLAGLQSLQIPTPKTDSEDFLPSPSQIDTDVMNELPADIRHQIQVALRRKQTRTVKSSKQSSHVVADNSDQPGCSHWTVESSKSSSGQTVEKSKEEAEDVNKRSPSHNISDIEKELLPNLSQVDESCFNQLPEEIQEEMRNAMKQREIRKQDEAIALSAAKSIALTSPPRKMMSLLSPTKASSPGKSRGVGLKRKSPGKSKRSPGKKWSPSFKVPRGRPRTRRGVGPRQVLDARKKLFLYGDIDKKYSTPISPETPSVEGSHSTGKPLKPVNLCGAISIAEVRNLLREWLTACSDPTYDDELYVVRYLKNLIEDKNLEQVDLVLKFLYRNICRLEAQKWFQSLRNIVESVQKELLTNYKSGLFFYSSKKEINCALSSKTPHNAKNALGKPPSKKPPSKHKPW